MLNYGQACREIKKFLRVFSVFKFEVGGWQTKFIFGVILLPDFG